MKPRKHRLILLLTAVILILVACDRVIETPKPPEGTYPVDPLFKALYNQLGGSTVLGPAISPVFRSEDRIYQYTVGALMMYDPELPREEQVRLAPIGLDMGRFELPVGGPREEGARYVDGYRIFDPFTKLYDQLGGEAFTGRPLTEAHKDLGKNRYEQTFENVGFYWFEGDSEDSAHLLAFGAWMCGQSCKFQSENSAAFDIPRQKVDSFVNTAAQLGLDFTGFARSHPVHTEDGLVKQVYENLVMVADPSDPEQVHLFTLPETVGVVREEPRDPSPAPDMEFYKVDGNLGFNVPRPFYDYIQVHGGFGFIGEPITHLARPDPTTMKQCFRNMCLQGNLLPEGEVEVRPQPLGLQYDLEISDPSAAGHLMAGDVTIQHWELYPMISPGAEQEIGVVVMSGGSPIPNIQVEMNVIYPGGDEKIYQLGPTDENGETRLQLPPIDAKNGTLIAYQACIQMQGQQRFCVKDGYLVWKTDYVTITPTLTPQQLSYLPFVVRNFRLYVPALLERTPMYLPLIINRQ